MFTQVVNISVIRSDNAEIFLERNMIYNKFELLVATILSV
jgi:hypothetical protein